MTADTDFHAVEVARRTPETDDTVTLTLAVSEPLRDRFRYRAGQFLSLLVPSAEGELVRSYSISTSPACDGKLAITVRRVPGGRVSNWLHDHAPPSSLLRATAPQGRFTVSDTQAPVVMVAAGSGITPCFSMIRTLLTTSDRKVTLVYASKSAHSIIFERELRRLADAAPQQFECCFHISGEHGEGARDRFFRMLEPRPGAEYYVCGAPFFVKAVRTHFLGRGVGEASIRFEAFSSPDRVAAPAAVESRPAALKVTLDGALFSAAVVPGQSLLEAGLAAGIDLPHSCQSGHCGSCMAMLRDGEVAQPATSQALSRKEIEQGFVLACQSRPTSAEVWLDYDY